MPYIPTNPLGGSGNSFSTVFFCNRGKVIWNSQNGCLTTHNKLPNELSCLHTSFEHWLIFPPILLFWPAQFLLFYFLMSSEFLLNLLKLFYVQPKFGFSLKKCIGNMTVSKRKRDTECKVVYLVSTAESSASFCFSPSTVPCSSIASFFSSNFAMLINTFGSAG